MPIVTGQITVHGAIVEVLVSVSKAQRELLERSGEPVPVSVNLRAVIDTGAACSGFTPKVFEALGIEEVAKVQIVTPSTPVDKPQECGLFYAGLSLVAEGRAYHFADLRVMATASWLPEEGFEALIGRDILDRCFFQYIGQDRKFTLAF